MIRRKTQFSGGLAWEAPWPAHLPALRWLTAPAPPGDVGVEPADVPGLIEVLQRGGVGADRRECPDLAGQLRSAVVRRPDTLICNLVDDDPRLRLNAVLWRHHALGIVAALRLLAGVLGTRCICLAAAADAPAGFVKMLQRLAAEAGARVVGFAAHYPQGHAALLVLTVLGRVYPLGQLPTEAGAVVVDAAAALAIDRLVRRGRPMSHVPVAVHDHVTGKSHYAMAPVGLKIVELLGHLDIPAGQRAIGAGALLEQVAVAPEDAVGPGALTFHAAGLAPPAPPAPPAACIRCGWCVAACPTRLQPAGLLEAAQLEDPELADRHGLGGCIECGLCSYVCPAHLPLLEAIRRLGVGG